MLRALGFYALVAVGVPLSLVQPFNGLLLYLFFAHAHPADFVWPGYVFNYGLLLVPALMIGYVLFEMRKSPLRFRGMLLLLAFWAWLAMAAIFAHNTDPAYAMLSRFSKMFVISLLIAAMANSEERIRKILTVLAGCLGFLGVKSLIGVILTGGADMDPRRNGQAMTAAVQPMPARREDADRHLLARIFERKTPVLGVGLGMQQLNVFAAGTLHLHLPTDNPRAMPHYDQTGAPHRHMVLIEPNTRLDEIYGVGELFVTSNHHQAVRQLGEGFRICAKAPDGVIEAIETIDGAWFAMGVQWHPQAESASALDAQLFECFLQAAIRHSEPLSIAA